MMHDNNGGSVMGMMRRMERHRRSDTAADIRNVVERSQDEEESIWKRVDETVPSIGKRLFGIGGDDGTSSSDNGGTGRSSLGDSGSDGLSGTDGSGDDGSGDDSTSSTRGTGGSRSGGERASSSDDTASTSTPGRPGGFTSYDDETSTKSSSSKSSDLFGFLTSSSSSTRTSTTPTSTSTSSTPTRTHSTSSFSTPSASSTSTSIMSNPATATSIALVTSSPTSNSDAVTATPKSDGPGAGPIIGIVAGSLAGVVVIVALVGFLVKKYNKKSDPYEDNPFDRGDFRRQSAMLPDTFDSDEGHHTMSEHNHMPASYSTDPDMMSNVGYATAGAAGAGAGAAGLAAASSFSSHNDSGRPRPPTVFERHMNAPAAQFSEAPPVPQVGAIFQPTHSSAPSLPPMVFGGSDPYSIAGVGRQYHDGNVANPYAHLDRQQSFTTASPQQMPARPFDNQQQHLNRNGSLESQGSYGQQQQQQQQQQNYYDESMGHGFDTAGRPSTAEGRSGTPDIPNMQQTYALGDANENLDHHHQQLDDGLERSGSGSSGRDEGYTSPTVRNSVGDPFQNAVEHNSPPQQPLQVRNLLPNPHQQLQQHLAGGAGRPISTASSQPADDEAAYGGVW